MTNTDEPAAGATGVPPTPESTTPLDPPPAPGPQQSGPQQSGPQQPGWASATATRPELRRSRHDRMIAGVAGGVARWLGIDPVIVRVVLVVLAVFGGSGLVLYALGWLFIPDEGDRQSAAQQFADRAGRPGSGSRTALIVAAVVIGLILLSGLSSAGAWGFWGGGSLLLLVLAGILVLYLVNRPPVPGTPMAQTPMAATAMGGAPVPPAPGFPETRAWDATQPTAAAGTVYSTAAPTTPVAGAAGAGAAGTGPDTADDPYATTGYAYGGYGSYPGYTGYSGYSTPPAPTVPRRPRSYLGLATLSLALVVMGVLITLNVSGLTSVPAVVVAAAGLGVLGLGLLVGAFAGRARWLIALALPLLLVTQVISIVPANLRLGGDVGDRTWSPTTPAAAAGEYRLDIGDAELDLTRLVLPTGDAATVPVRASVGTGDLDVIVPEGVRVDLTATTGLGRLAVEGLPEQDGADLAVTGPLPGPVSPSSPTIDLVVEVGIGDLEVSREAS